jgi:hypothetical protein
VLSPTSLSSRRQLLRAGATGVAAVAVGAHWSLIEGVASAAPLPPALMRSTWTALHDPRLTAATGDTRLALELVRVADLPVASVLTGLRGSDEAFVLEFTGPAGLPQGIVALSSPELGSAVLYLGPIAESTSGPQRYEAVVDRTVRIAGINEEGAPLPVDAPAARAALPPAVTAAGVTAPPPPNRRAVRTPVLRRASVARGRTRRQATVDLSLAQTRDIVGVRAALLRRDATIARASSPQRAPHGLKLRLTSSASIPAGRYTLLVRMTARDGTVTSARRAVRLS